MKRIFSAFYIVFSLVLIVVFEGYTDTGHLNVMPDKVDIDASPYATVHGQVEWFSIIGQTYIHIHCLGYAHSDVDGNYTLLAMFEKKDWDWVGDWNRDEFDPDVYEQDRFEGGLYLMGELTIEASDNDIDAIDIKWSGSATVEDETNDIIARAYLDNDDEDGRDEDFPEPEQEDTEDEDGEEASNTPSTPSATVPGPPANVSAQGYDGWIYLTFASPSNNGGSDITSYKYRYSVTYGTYGDWITWDSLNNPNISVNDLTNGTQYQFQVRAVNSVGEGTVSDTVYATPVAPCVWSNIPDPYRLIVGQSFSLNLKDYVVGFPTITHTSGTLPAGLSLSNGVLSGTPTSAETQSIRFTATNSWGYTAESESIEIIITNGT